MHLKVMQLCHNHTGHHWKQQHDRIQQPLTQQVVEEGVVGHRPEEAPEADAQRLSNVLGPAQHPGAGQQGVNVWLRAAAMRRWLEDRGGASAGLETDTLETDWRLISNGWGMCCQRLDQEHTYQVSRISLVRWEDVRSSTLSTAQQTPGGLSESCRLFRAMGVQGCKMLTLVKSGMQRFCAWPCDLSCSENCCCCAHCLPVSMQAMHAVE